MGFIYTAAPPPRSGGRGTATGHERIRSDATGGGAGCALAHLLTAANCPGAFTETAVGRLGKGLACSDAGENQITATGGNRRKAGDLELTSGDGSVQISGFHGFGRLLEYCSTDQAVALAVSMRA